MKILNGIYHLRKIHVANTIHKAVPYRKNSSHFLEQHYDKDGILRPPKYFNFAHDVVDQWAKLESEGKRDKQSPALWMVKKDGKEYKWNYNEISDMSKRAANFLEKECKLGRGDKIMLILPLILEWWLLKLGASRIGAIVSSGTIQLSPKDIEYRATQLEATCIVTDEKNAPKVDKIASNIPTLKNKVLVDPESSSEKHGWINFNRLYFKYDSNHQCSLTKSDETFTIFFTSGTTGSPKMVEHTHSSLGLGLYNDSKYYLRAKQGNLFWCISDPGWIKAAYVGFYCVWMGGAGVFTYEMSKFDPHIVLQVLQKYPLSSFMTVPTSYRMILQNYPNQPLNVSPTITNFFTGGEPIESHLLARWENQTGIKIREVYGQTEMLTSSTMSMSIPYKRGSIGKPFLGTELVVIDENLKEVKPKEVGQFAVRIDKHRPLNLFKGYYRDPKKNAEVFQGNYYLTGDRGYVDEDGYFWYVSRNDDVISSAGYRIGPAEVEEALNSHPAVSESAVVSSPDSERGEVVKAFVVLKPENKENPDPELPQRLQDHVKSITAPYKCPRRVEFIDALPKNISGKIQRAVLRKKEWENK